MPLLEWTDGFSVGFERIDEDHKKFFDMINKAYDSPEDTHNADIARELLADMRQYALFHFETEETLMAQYGYPNEQEHRDMHYNFTKKIVETEANAATGQAPINLYDTLKFLADWLSEHILEADHELGAFLKDKA